MITEGLVLTVQTRQVALNTAAFLVAQIPAALIEGDIPDVVLKYANRFETYLQRGPGR